MSRVGILVLGMHRSGTSALTWLLGRLGAALPADSIAPSGENERGYWESQGLVKADDQLLRVCRSSWFDPRPLDWSRLSVSAINSRRARMREAIERGWGDAPVLAIKDPRQCRFVPVFAGVLEEMGVEPRAVLMLRAPGEIAASIASRDGTTPAFAHLLWLRHMIDAERATRDMPRVVVDYDALLADWRGTARRLAPLAGWQGWEPGEPGAGEIDRFIDPSLRHHRTPAIELEEPLAGIVAAVDEGLRGLLDNDGEAAREWLDQAYASLDAHPWLEGDIVHDELRHRRAPAAPPPPVTAPAPEPVADIEADMAAIHASGLFDVDFYLANYPEVAEGGFDPVRHYLEIGAPKGYNPNPLFDTVFYARQLARRLGAER